MFPFWFLRCKKAKQFDPWEKTVTAGMDQLAQNTRRYLADSDYLLPKDQEEEFRLNFQHHALFHAIGSHYVAPINQATRMILDVGTGTGVWPIEMARLFPSAEVVGIDIDTALFKPEVPENCYLRAGDVLTSLPFPNHLFSYTHQRLLTAAIIAEKWPGVIRELVRVTRSGGWIELIEIDNQMQNAGPASVHLQTLMESVSKSMGFDGEVIRHLGNLLKQEGLQSVEMQRIFIPVGEWGGRVGSMMKRDLLSVMEAVKAVYCTRGNISPGEYNELVQAAADEWEIYRSCCTFFAAYARTV